MKLTTDQKQAVATWVAAGASLNEVQDRLKSEFGVVLTFMDTRFLLSDLGLALKTPADEEEEEEEKDVIVADGLMPDEVGGGGELLQEDPAGWPEEAVAETEVAVPGAPPAQVRVTVDTVTLPGAMVSGKVTFSDGVSGGWYLDQMGQLGLTGIDRGYQPPESDVVAFQRELQRALR